MEAVGAQHSWQLFFKEEAESGNGTVQKPLRIELPMLFFQSEKNFPKL